MPKRTPGPFRVLSADPPWTFDDRLPGKGRGAEKHYSTMSTADIARFPLPPLFDEAWLFLWRVHTHQEEARFVMKAWGFTYASELVWVKLAKSGSPKMGMGRTLRMQHEVCLIGRRGRPPMLSRAVRSTLEAPLGEHSEKPAAFFDLVERFTPGPYVELFARTKRDGWTAFGKQVGRPHP